MSKEKNRVLFAAGTLSIVAALLHISVIVGGPDWYRFFGAGEGMARMAEQGMIYPVLVTLFITGVLTAWGLYAYSGANYIRRLPLLRLCLVLITLVYCVRGTYGFFVPVFSNDPYVENLGVGFWVWSSAICLFIGVLHFIGVKQSWSHLTAPDAQ